MDLPVRLQPGELLTEQLLFWPNRDSQPYAFAVSSRAIHLLARKRGFVTGNPWYLERVSADQVQNIALTRARPWGLYFLALILLAFGLLNFLPLITGGVMRLRGASFAAIAGGIVLPFLAKGRRAITVVVGAKRRTFTAPLVVDGRSRQEVARIQERFLQAARKIGIRCVTSAA